MRLTHVTRAAALLCLVSAACVPYHGTRALRLPQPAERDGPPGCVYQRLHLRQELDVERLQWNYATAAQPFAHGWLTPADELFALMPESRRLQRSVRAMQVTSAIAYLAGSGLMVAAVGPDETVGPHPGEWAMAISGYTLYVTALLLLAASVVEEGRRADAYNAGLRRQLGLHDEGPVVCERTGVPATEPPRLTSWLGPPPPPSTASEGPPR